MKLRHRLKQRNKRRHLNGATKATRVAAKDTAIIPTGYYCYGNIVPSPPGESWALYSFTPCPYWEKLPGKYCARCNYLEEDDDGILWDRVKICDHERHDEFDEVEIEQQA